jgi:hypothetical protein
MTAHTSGRDFAMEGHLRALGLWNYLTGAAIACGAVAIVIEGVTKPGDLAGSVVVALLLLLLGGGIATLGYFLRDLSDRVRRTYKVLGIIGLIGGVLGAFGNVAQAMVHDRSVAAVLVSAILNAAWMLFFLYTIDSPRALRICTPEYRSGASAAPGPHGFASPFFWGPFALFGVIFLVTVAAQHR